MVRRALPECCVRSSGFLAGVATLTCGEAARMPAWPPTWSPPFPMVPRTIWHAPGTWAPVDCGLALVDQRLEDAGTTLQRHQTDWCCRHNPLLAAAAVRRRCRQHCRHCRRGADIAASWVRVSAEGSCGSGLRFGYRGRDGRAPGVGSGRQGFLTGRPSPGVRGWPCG